MSLDVFLTLLNIPSISSTLPNILVISSTSPITGFYFIFLHPLPSSHHPLNLTRHLQTCKKMTKLHQGHPLSPRDVPKKEEDASNPGYLSCGFYFFNFCLLCNIIDFSSWGSHMYNKWRLYIVWAIAQSHGDGLRSSFSKDPFPPLTLPWLITSFPLFPPLPPPFRMWIVHNFQALLELKVRSSNFISKIFNHFWDIWHFIIENVPCV